MARTIVDTSLDSRTARGRLKARGKPYWRQIEPGLHLGYRKPLSGAGRWVVRHYTGGGQYQIEAFNIADDFSDSDGVAILDFRQALTEARKRFVRRAHDAAGVTTKPLTVAACLDEYVAFLEDNRKSAREARYSIEADIKPAFGKIRVDQLTTEEIRKWHANLAKAGARVRTKKGEAQRFRDSADDPQAVRRRKSTANRILTVLKAALNRAWRDGKITNDFAWRRVEPFESVDSARARYLSIAEARRLVNAADPDFRKLIQAALETGCRYGELCRLVVADFNSDSGTITILESKSGKARHVVLSADGTRFFAALTAGRAGAEVIFLKADGAPWLDDHQSDPIAAANKRAKISPPANFHCLRHTWASHAVMAGMPLMLVARNLGHSTTRMVEKHYGHLAPGFVTDTIRKHAPRFGVKAGGNVERIR